MRSPRRPPAIDVDHGRGALVISLDFELYWGVRHKLRLDDYRHNLLGVRRAVPALLDLFREYEIHATWAAVGFLFCSSRDELHDAIPAITPQYSDARLCPYRHVPTIGANEDDDPFHYGASLIRLIQSYPHQEIGTHTFSHYYCLEEGQTIDAFREDLRAAAGLAQRSGLELKSLVFPRNQFNHEYLSVCHEAGIEAYRGNPASWLYRPRRTHEQTRFQKAARLLDAYLNISGHNAWAWSEIAPVPPFNVPASRFLRPYTRRLGMLDPLRRRRILSDLTYAARHRRVYHLWWHPHNFGAETEKNVDFLRRIVAHHSDLRARYGMESLNMREVAAHIRQRTGVSATVIFPG